MVRVERERGEQEMKLPSLTHPLLTSCCAAQFLTGHRPVLVCSLGVGDPWSKTSAQSKNVIILYIFFLLRNGIAYSNDFKSFT